MFGFSNKKESGAIVLNGQHTSSTCQCVHCGNHFIVVSGSGKKRGWCFLCSGFLCGSKTCMETCIPFEARLEYQEAIDVKNLKHVNKLLNKYPEIQNLNL